MTPILCALLALSSSPLPQDGPKAPSVEAKLQLLKISEVPEPETVAPYRFALVTQECKVLAIVGGKVDGVKVGAVVRVARWGISQAKKTDVAKAKKGDKVVLKLERMSDHPSLERQFTVDSLPEDLKAPYLLDVTTKAPTP